MRKLKIVNTLVAASAAVLLAGAALFVVSDRHENVPVRAESSQATRDKAASVSLLIGGLEARLAENPDDAKGWMLLARSHDHLGDNTNAWNAYTHARDLGMTDEALEIKLATSLVGALEE